MSNVPEERPVWNNEPSDTEQGAVVILIVCFHSVYSPSVCIHLVFNPHD